MDILDIDEIEDDFGIFEEKMQDDVTNILKQWKIGNNKKDAVFDSRTFTRPKGSIIRNSIDGSQLKSPQFQDNQNGMCMKIGGMVSNVQKSFLNDISPPNSICSSINFENETISNSLVTSADFSNISFFKTSLMDSNIDFAFKNNLKQYNNIENERFKYEKNIPSDFYNNDTTMKSSVSKDSQQHDSGEKFDTEENFNLLTDSTKENSPNCPEADNNGSSFQNNTQIMSNTFTKRNSTTCYDSSMNNVKKTELDERPKDINKTFLSKSKIEPQMNKTFGIGLNIPCSNTNKNGNKPLNPNKQSQTQNLNETLILKAAEKNTTYESDQINSAEQSNAGIKDVIIPSKETLYNSFENATSTPQKNAETEIDNNIDFSPITPFKTSYKFRKQSNEEELSSSENLFDIPMEIEKDNPLLDRNCNNHKTIPSSFEHDDLDIDNLSDLSDKIENFKEDAMKKSLETIKKRYSHKFDKTTHIAEKLAIQKISNPFPDNGRLLSRRSRLNDNLVLNHHVINETEQETNQDIENEKSENLFEREIKNSEQCSQLDPTFEKESNVDEKDINTKKKHEPKRSRNDDRFKTIKINKPLAEQYKEKTDINETECNISTAFARIDKNSKISNFENDPLKLENNLNAKIRQQQFTGNEKSIPGSIKNLKYERISKIENLGKSISASNLESATETEQNANFKFAAPAPVKQIKSPMGTKAKSFHNLASNNFGFGFKKQSLQIPLRTQENSFLSTTGSNSTAVKSNSTRSNDSSRSKSIATLRPTNPQKKSGLLRPSSGYFSRGVSSELNTVQTTFTKDNEKCIKSDSNCSNLTSPNYDTIKKDELNSTTVIKTSKLIKPTESKLPTNIKRSGLPRPSLYYRK